MSPSDNIFFLVCALIGAAVVGSFVGLALVAVVTWALGVLGVHP